MSDSVLISKIIASMIVGLTSLGTLVYLAINNVVLTNGYYWLLAYAIIFSLIGIHCVSNGKSR